MADVTVVDLAGAVRDADLAPATAPPVADVVVIADDGDTPASLPAQAVVSEEIVLIPDEAEEDADTLPPHAEMQEDGSVRLPLRYPVTLSYKKASTGAVTRTQHWDELVMHRLTGAAMRAIMAAQPKDASMVGMAHSCRMAQGVFNALFDRMDGADGNAAAQVLSFFLSPGTTTGRPRSQP